jgi:hypothetical protein
MLQVPTAATDNQQLPSEVALTRMLIVVCVTFTLCTIPAVTLSFIRNLVPGFLPSGRYTNAFYVSNILQHLLSCFNSSVNVVIYYVMGSRFRATVQRMAVFRLCCRGDGERYTKGMDGSLSVDIGKEKGSGGCSASNSSTITSVL